MQYYEPPPNPLTLGLDGAALAVLWGLLALLVATLIGYLTGRAILTRRSAPTIELRRPDLARYTVRAAAALTFGAVTGWPLLAAAFNSPIAAADSSGAAPEGGLPRNTIVVNHAVSEQFPQIEHIAAFRPDPLGELAAGLPLDILIPSDPASVEGAALGNQIRDFLLEHGRDLGVEHLMWRQHHYRADGTSVPKESRSSDVADHLTHLHVTTAGGGFP